MNRFFPLLIFLFILSSFRTEKEKEYPFEKWTTEELEKANTAKAADYLSEEEKKVIFYTNLVRIDPKLFGETYAQRFIDSAGYTSAYAHSLLAQLKRGKPLQALLPDSVLSAAAAEHAVATGKSGRIGHSGNKKRFKQVRNRFSLWGENCSYGYDQALDILMQLLIDENTSSLGHRKNILKPEFTHIGTGISEHIIYKWTCVQDFGGQYSGK